MSEQTCSARVWNKWGYRHENCTRKASVERDGKGYCKQHDPVAKAEREAARQKRWKEESEARAKKWRLDSAAPDLLAALEGFVTFHSGHVLHPEIAHRMEAARKAIAQAKGESA